MWPAPSGALQPASRQDRECWGGGACMQWHRTMSKAHDGPARHVSEVWGRDDVMVGAAGRASYGLWAAVPCVWRLAASYWPRKPSPCVRPPPSPGKDTKRPRTEAHVLRPGNPRRTHQGCSPASVSDHLPFRTHIATPMDPAVERDLVWAAAVVRVRNRRRGRHYPLRTFVRELLGADRRVPPRPEAAAAELVARYAQRLVRQRGTGRCRAIVMRIRRSVELVGLPLALLAARLRPWRVRVLAHLVARRDADALRAYHRISWGDPAARAPAQTTGVPTPRRHSSARGGRRAQAG